MLHAHVVVPASEWSAQDARDSVTLAHDARHRRRIVHTSDGGLSFLLELPQAVVLRDGDGLRLSDGSMIAVRAASEAVMDVRAADPVLLLRLAWHIGNRHLPAEIGADHIRLRQDHVILAMLEGLGAEVRLLTAPFTPLAGAYADNGGERRPVHQHAHHHHAHDHAHHHDHA